MNNSSKNIYIVLLVCLIGLVSFGVYYLHAYVTDFSNRSADVHAQVQKLEDSKKTIELYRKILATGSKEQEQLGSYILSGDAVFTAITVLEKDGKKTGLYGTGGILSVSKRENESLKNLQAGEVVVQISVEGKTNDVNLYIQALANLPYASHIEKVNLNFSNDSSTTKADITLVITELL